MLTLDNRALRDAAAAAPYEFIEILVNERTYGGGGIFNDHATASVDSAFSDYVFVHEFGHHFAALADEYYTSDVAYETGAAAKQEPWEPNVTALRDPAALKWRDLVTAGTPLPTPWPKEAFEEHSRGIQERRRAIRKRNGPEEEMDALFREQRAFEEKLLGTAQHAGAVGAFEGASYEARGLYRPQADCIMFTRDRRRLLPRLPARHQPHHRPLLRKGREAPATGTTPTHGEPRRGDADDRDRRGGPSARA